MKRDYCIWLLKHIGKDLEIILLNAHYNNVISSNHIQEQNTLTVYACLESVIHLIQLCTVRIPKCPLICEYPFKFCTVEPGN